MLLDSLRSSLATLSLYAAIRKKSELSIEYGRTFQILFGEYYYSSYRYRLTLSMATLCKASQDFLPNPL